MPESVHTQKGTFLAFDFGVKRIGIAVGEWPLAQAYPLKTIRSERNDERFSAVAALIDEWKPVGLVVGLPVALDGSPHAMTARCVRFANQLRGRFGIAVEYADVNSGITEACAAFDAISTAMLTQVVTDRRGELHTARRGA